ncbi:MAG: dioxygenase [Planctomycetes bacterium]|nr:dioxygenase [Planctomycetota bacterium]
MPSLFVSHGAPSLLLEDAPVRTFLAGMAKELPRPRAILCVSAHWTTRATRVDVSTAPETLHDFAGFPEELYRMRYPAPGSPGLARDVALRLKAAGIEAETSSRGLDHGAWAPLKLMYPAADVPVVQLALQPHLGAAHHVALGRALAGLRQEGVLVLGSGGATHNLGELGAGDHAPDWVRRFDDWLVERVERGDERDLVGYRALAPDSARCHPTEEHLFPLHVAFGAAGGDTRGRTLHRSTTWGTLAMTAFRFDGA